MAQMGDESEDETPDNEEDDGKGFLLSDDGKDIDLRYGLQSVHSLSLSVCAGVYATYKNNFIAQRARSFGIIGNSTCRTEDMVC